MIVQCPACLARRDAPAFEMEGGTTLVDCAKCGHEWVKAISLPAVSELRTTAIMAISTNSTEPDTRHLLETARGARKEFEKSRRARRVRIATWSGLAALAITPLGAAAVFPEQVVTTTPATIRAYDWLGLDVNIYGLEIRQVDLQHLIVDGRKVIAVKGELSNTSSTIRKIPWLRFGLRSRDNTEVYHWTLDTEVRPLKPGESTSFVTRLASPPEAARNLEIRFARVDEIGSNNGP